MVRFIIQAENIIVCLGENLHSNMVRFIMQLAEMSLNAKLEFTFQYG